MPLKTMLRGVGTKENSTTEEPPPGTKPIDAVTKATTEPPMTTEEPSASKQNPVVIEGRGVEEEQIPTIITTVVEEGEKSDNN